MSKRRRTPGSHRGSAPDEGGFDPDTFFTNPFAGPGPEDRKSAQLCAAAARIMSTALACDVDDPVLADLVLDTVVPEPGGGRLLATFLAPPGTDLPAAQEHLNSAAGVFRSALALGLSRKRVPAFVLRVLPAPEAQP